MKVQFLANRVWAHCGVRHDSKKGDVLDVCDGLAEILIRTKAAKKHTAKKKATK